MADASTLESCASGWKNLCSRACEHDTWGQMEEAVEIYQQLLSAMHTDIKSISLSMAQQALVGDAISCITARVEALQGTELDGINASQMQKLHEFVFVRRFAGGAELPAELRQYAAAGSGRTMSAGMKGTEVIEDVDTHDDDATTKIESQLLPPIKDKGTRIEVIVDRIGLKDADDCIDPFISVSVIDHRGKFVGKQQSTSPPSKRRPQYINFGCLVHLQNVLDDMGAGWAILFECKHFKPRSKKISTKCWCFIEFEDIRAGQQALELYKKPTIMDTAEKRLKNVKLHTIKPLFLHVDLKLRA